MTGPQCLSLPKEMSSRLIYASFVPIFYLFHSISVGGDHRAVIEHIECDNSAHDYIAYSA